MTKQTTTSKPCSEVAYIKYYNKLYIYRKRNVLSFEIGEKLDEEIGSGKEQ